jgi:hypothetical protein
MQRFLVTNRMGVENALVGRLYSEMTKVHKSSKLGMDDPDAIAFANAYLAAIDGRKHTIDVLLPEHLRTRVGL